MLIWTSSQFLLLLSKTDSFQQTFFLVLWVDVETFLLEVVVEDLPRKRFYIFGAGQSPCFDFTHLCSDEPKRNLGKLRLMGLLPLPPLSVLLNLFRRSLN